MKVGRRYFFTAHHSLPGIEGWADDHEHRYTVEVEAEGEPPFAVNMEHWDNIAIAFIAWEGADLNESFEPSTVENIARFLLKDFPDATALTVWEDDDRWARAER